jgi:hypothetical protein
MVQKVDTPLPQDRQMPHWFWQVYTYLNNRTFSPDITIEGVSGGAGITITAPGSNGVVVTNTATSTSTYHGVSGSIGYGGTTTSSEYSLFTNNTKRLIVSNTGNVTINAPSSGTALTLNVLASTEGVSFSDGTVTGIYGTITTTSTFWGTKSNHSLQIRTNNTDRVDIAAAGNVTINAPSSGTALRVTGTTGAARIAVWNGSYHEYQLASTTFGYLGDRTGVLGSGSGMSVRSEGSLYLSCNGATNVWKFDSTYAQQPTTTVGSLVAAGTAGAGARSFVTDANATTFASVVAGGGGNGVPVYSDGTNWRIG